MIVVDAIPIVVIAGTEGAIRHINHISFNGSSHRYGIQRNLEWYLPQ